MNKQIQMVDPTVFVSQIVQGFDDNIIIMKVYMGQAWSTVLKILSYNAQIRFWLLALAWLYYGRELDLVSAVFKTPWWWQMTGTRL